MQQNKQINNRIKSHKRLVDGIVRPVRRSRREKETSSNVEYKIDSKKVVLYSGLKMFGASIAAIVLFFSFSSIGDTVAYYKNIEKSIGNFLQADPLSFVLVLATSTEESVTSDTMIDLSGLEKKIIPVMTPDSLSEPIQYFVTSKITGGDSALCEAVNVLGTFPFPYDGKLASIYTATTTDTGSWTLSLSVPEESKVPNSLCIIDLVYFGWNADAPFGRGYRDKQKITLTLYIPSDYLSSNNVISLPIEIEESTDEPVPDLVLDKVPPEPLMAPDSPATVGASTTEVPLENSPETLVETPPEVPAEAIPPQPAPSTDSDALPPPTLDVTPPPADAPAL